MNTRPVSRRAWQGNMRRQAPGEMVAIVTSEGRIVAMRILLSTSLLLAIAVHWLTR